jgi:hypothetical protein
VRHYVCLSGGAAFVVLQVLSFVQHCIAVAVGDLQPTLLYTAMSVGFSLEFVPQGTSCLQVVLFAHAVED